MECDGDGRCLTDCSCSYYIGTNDCNCYEYVHNHLYSSKGRFCIIYSECKYRCVLTECKNFNHCQEKQPDYLYKNEQCENCNAFDINFINENNTCFICYEDKYLIETKCKHQFCLDCLIKLNWEKPVDENPCPFCLKNMDFNLKV
jgi:hypothetical protein